MKNDAALWQRGMEWGKELLAPLPRSHAEAYRHELKYLISYADKASWRADGPGAPPGPSREAGRVLHPQPLL